jgi:hypothetical protein
VTNVSTKHSLLTMNNLEREMALQQTIIQCAWGFDQTDLDPMASCFTTAAKLVSGVVEIAGRDATRTHFEARRRLFTERNKQPCVTTNVPVDSCRSETAQTRSYFVLLASGAERVSAGVAGWREDSLVKDEGRCRIASRQTHADRC